MANGCGCQTGMFKWLKPPYSRRFHKACVFHDESYDLGGDNKDRKRADRMLYFFMLSCLKKEESPWRHTWFTLIALLYYASVRIFGRFYFNYKSE